MDYLGVYKTCFSDQTYSNAHHVQYDYVIEKIASVHKDDDAFSLIDIGSGRGQLIALIKQKF